MSPDGNFHLQDAEHTLAMGPIENVIQGFGQCCGFPIQVLLHGICTVPHKTPTTLNVHSGQDPATCRRVATLTFTVVISFARSVPPLETHVCPLQGYETGGFSNGSSGGSAISPQGWM